MAERADGDWSAFLAGLLLAAGTVAGFAQAEPTSAEERESPARGGKRPLGNADRVHLLFWQASDILDAEGVTFEAHPFGDDCFEVLLEAEAERSSLWYMPTDVIAVEEGFRIYYQRVEREQPEWVHQRAWCMGLLRDDGFHLPDLKLHEQPWDGPANIVLQRSPHQPTWGGFNVFQVAGTADSGLKLLYWDQPEHGSAGAMLATSPDGIHWKKDAGSTVFTEHNDAYTLVHSAHSDEFLLYQTHLKSWPEKPFPDNLAGRRRVISLRRSPDLVNWSPQRIILEPDGLDAETAEFYLLKVFRYADRYVGLLMKYFANPERPNRHSDLTAIELVFSQDGVAWERPFRDTDVGLWTYADLFEHQGSLCAVAHRNRHLVLARTRPDGLASVGAVGPGSFVTPPFAMPAAGLHLNADCSDGFIDVELLADDGTVLGTCQFEGVDGVDLRVEWQDAPTEVLEGRTVRLRFAFARARIYSVLAAHTDG